VNFGQSNYCATLKVYTNFSQNAKHALQERTKINLRSKQIQMVIWVDWKCRTCKCGTTETGPENGGQASESDVSVIDG